jgi:hypothetical protein
MIIKSHLIYNDNYDNYDNYSHLYSETRKLFQAATDCHGLPRIKLLTLQVQAALQKLRCVVSERFVVPRVCRGVEDLG